MIRVVHKYQVGDTLVLDQNGSDRVSVVGFSPRVDSMDFKVEAAKSTWNSYGFKLRIPLEEGGIYVWRVLVDKKSVEVMDRMPAIQLEGHKSNVIVVGYDYSIELIQKLYNMLGKVLEVGEVSTFLDDFSREFDINTKFYWNGMMCTLLHVATFLQLPGVIKYLLEKGASPYVPLDSKSKESCEQRTLSEIIQMDNFLSLIPIFTESYPEIIKKERSGITTKKSISEPSTNYTTFKRKHILTEPEKGSLIEELDNHTSHNTKKIKRERKIVKEIYMNRIPDPKLKPGCYWRRGYKNPLLAVRYYTSESLNLYTKVNKILRNRVSGTKEEKKQAQKDMVHWGHFAFNLQSAIINLPGTKETEVVYRGLTLKPEELKKENKDLDFELLMKNKENIVWGGFTSCSKSAETAKRHFAKGEASIIFEITVPPYQGAYIAPFSLLQREEEVILPALSEFEITSVEKNKNDVKQWIRLTYRKIDETNMPRESIYHRDSGIIKRDGSYFIDLPLFLDVSRLKFTNTSLGSGSFGDVWLAQYQYDDVAVKILKNFLCQEERLVCEREIGLMAKCDSPNVVKLRGTCLNDEKFYIVMEYMSNGNLQKYLEKRKNNRTEAPLKLRYKMACQIVKGVHHLHSKGIVHSDIKSSNILLDEYYNAKISDFGISKIRSTTLGTIGPNKGGTVKWLAPEVENDAKPTTKETDIFSVGFTLWELMSFEIPFSKCTNKEYLYKITYGSKKEEIPEGTPPVLKECIERCWEKDPILRPTAIELVEKLKMELKNLPSEEKKDKQ